jgi:short-subunit dehydrogenase
VVSGLSRRLPDATVCTHPVSADVTDAAAFRRAVALCREKAGPIDSLVYGAGYGAMGKTLAIPTNEAERTFAVNYWGLVTACGEVVPEMVARRRGSVIAVLSIVALRAVTHEAHYAASKAAADRYLGCLAREVSGAGVCVQRVLPGYVPTGFFVASRWFGMEKPPSVSGSGITAEDVAARVLRGVSGRRIDPLLGWRERVIALSDRLAPGLYDRVLDYRQGQRG